MRENRTYGLTRGRSGGAASLYSTANNARSPEHSYFAQMLHRNKNTDVTQKIPRNICENESV